MRNPFLRSFVLGCFLLFLVAISSAQDIITTETESGYRFDHPEEWLISPDEDVESIVYFNDGAMYGVISILDNRILGDDPEEILEELIDDLNRDDANNGDFEEPFTEYELDNTWEVVRATRVRQSDRLLEYFIMADGNDTSVFIRASFRRGGEDSYLPQFDAMIASVRHEDDEPEIVENSELSGAETLGLEFIGLEGNLLQVGALTENYVFEDESYELDYPTGWEINTSSDAGLRFINRDGITLFGTMQVLDRGEQTAESALENYLGTTEGFGEIESFSLNGFRAARAYRDDAGSGLKEIAMTAQRSDSITLLTAATNSDDFDALEPVFRAVLYSLRPNGSPLELSLVGTGARAGLTSAYIYGTVSATSSTTTGSNPRPNVTQSAIPLETGFETSNGEYQFNYPEDWTQNMEQSTIVLCNNEEYRLFDPVSGEVQMMIFFIDRIQNLRIDEFSPETLLAYIIANDTDPTLWEDVNEFESLGRRGAYADFDGETVDWMMRTYLVELNEDARIYVRIDMVARVNDMEEFHPYALAILETAEETD